MTKSASPKIVLPCGFWVGLLVVVIGLYIVWKLIEFCMTHPPFAKQDPPAPEPNITNVVDESALFLQPASHPLLNSPSTADTSPGLVDAGCYISFQILSVPDGPIELVQCEVVGTQSMADFNAELSRYGQSMSAPKHPADIQWDGTTLTVGSGETQRIVIEQSMDMVNWQAVATNVYSVYSIPWVTLPAPCRTNCFWRVAVSAQ